MAKCPYCQGWVQRKASSAHRYSGLDYGPIIECDSCGAFAGDRLGAVVADERDRGLRKEGHGLIDPFWRKGTKSRSQVYQELANLAGVPEERAHFGRLGAPS